MAQDDLDRSDPSRLADALSIHPETPERLSATELGAILEHQLTTPLEFDLGEIPPSQTAHQTLGELLTGDSPPALELLERAKAFAKFCKSSSDGPLPVEVASVLYFATIVRAQLVHGVRISALSDSNLAQGVHWSLEQPWVRGRIRDLLERGH